jgi:predicted outer membrane repeat protein
MKPQFSSLSWNAQDWMLLSACRAQLALAAPDISRILTDERPELSSRFAAHHAKLLALPRRTRRALQRRWKQSLAGVALLLTLGTAPAFAATINVGANCALPDAITAANLDVAIGGCAVGSGADTIVLPPQTIRTLTTVNNTTYGSNGLPVITSAVTIAGNGSTIARSQLSGTPVFRLLTVAATGDLRLQGVVLRGGVASGAFPAGLGGGVFNIGRLVMIDSTLSGSSANRGGGVYNFIGGTMSASNSTISGNSAVELGGGVANGATLTVSNSTISGNTAGELGGGVINSAGTVSITSSLLSGNSAEYGGGVDNGGSLNIANTTFSGNSATSTGGAIRSRSGTVNLFNCTLTGNAAAAGGGIANAAPGMLKLVRSLISGNAGNNPEISSTSGSVEADRFNLFGHSGVAGVAGFSPGETDLVPNVALNAILDPVLRANGGFSQTHALLRASPAVDPAGRCDIGRGAGLIQDQRGALRPFDGNADGVSACDIGAFELIFCGGRAPTHIGTPRAEVINGTAGVDVIDGLGGNDTLNGLGANDVLCGGVGNDVLNGGTGIDAAAFTGTLILIGPLGVTVHLDTGIATGDGRDNLDMLAGIENVIGSAGSDTIIGDAGPNGLSGGRGNDVLLGVGGNDRLLGGLDNDTAIGGLGVDTCDGQAGAGDIAMTCETVVGVP